LSTPPIVDNQLLVCAVAQAGFPLLTQFTKRVFDTGCNLVDTRLAVLGQEVTLVAQIAGTWDQIAKLETALSRLEREEQVGMLVRRTTERTLTGTHLPYAVEVVSADRPGLLHQVNDFFVRRGVLIDTITSSKYRAQQTGADMFTAQFGLAVPASMPVAHLREEFLDFCDHLNLDAIMDPVKG
jgi:glycine cleavage system transcriptional repressor